MNRILYFLIVAVVFFATSCSGGNKEAREAYMKAKTLYEAGDYDNAKLMIDSIKILGPKAFDEIRAGIQLTRVIELAINKEILKRVDSIMPIYREEQERLLGEFDFIKDEEYQTEGLLVYKNNPNKLSQEKSCLRIQVTEKGEMQLLSVYCGAYPLQHESIKVSLPDGTYAMTTAVPYDGASNYRYYIDGRNIETITYSEPKMRRVADFIVAAENRPVTVSYEGKKPFSFKLDNTTRKAITESYKLATVIKNIASLEREDVIASRAIVVLNRQIEEHKNDSI